MSIPLYLQHGGAAEVTYRDSEVCLAVPTIHNAEYELALLDVFKNGTDRGDRTGTGTRSLFGVRMEFDLQNGFPLITTKKVFFRGIVEELLWFLRGETNVKSLQDKGVHIWDEWAAPNGDVGPVYGKQWRAWPSVRAVKHGMNTLVSQTTIDQLSDVINQIKGNPESRRMVISAWNPADIPDMALPPCHVLSQFYVTADGHLDLQLYQRSGDMFLGIPFNIASYALLLHIVANECGVEPGRLIHVIGDAHIYHNHFDQVKEQLSREPRPFPQLEIVTDGEAMEGLTYANFKLTGYNPHPAIKGEVSV